jgi:hypothetical protein
MTRCATTGGPSATPGWSLPESTPPLAPGMEPPAGIEAQRRRPYRDPKPARGGTRICAAQVCMAAATKLHEISELAS